jgi:hypothetical protein
VKAISARMSSMAVASAVCAVGAIGESHCERKKSQKQRLYDRRWLALDLTLKKG